MIKYPGLGSSRLSDKGRLRVTDRRAGEGEDVANLEKDVSQESMDVKTRREQQALSFLSGSYIKGVVDRRESDIRDPCLRRIELQVISPQGKSGMFLRETTGTVVIEVSRTGDVEISMSDVEYDIS